MLNIIAADDEKLALDNLMTEINVAVPDLHTMWLTVPNGCWNMIRENGTDLSFLDIEMRGMSVLMLVKELKKLCTKINIIFVTGFSQYAVNAASIRCGGYLLKLVSSKAIAVELLNLKKTKKNTDNA